MGIISAEWTLALLGLASAVIGVWYALDRYINSVKRDSIQRFEQMERDLYDFKLQVSKEYTHWSHLKSVEERLEKQIDRLILAIDMLRERIPPHGKEQSKHPYEES